MFGGEDITSLKAFQRIRRGMSVKFQVPGIFKALSVRQNLEIAMQHHYDPSVLAEEIDKLLAFLNLTADATASPAISRRPEAVAGNRHGGQPQAAPSAARRAHRRHVAGGDPRHRRNGQALNAEGMTVLAVEHDMAFVRQVAHKVTVLHLGRVFAQGSIDEIVANEDVAAIYLGQTTAHETAHEAAHA